MSAVEVCKLLGCWLPISSSGRGSNVPSRAKFLIQTVHFNLKCLWLFLCSGSFYPLNLFLHTRYYQFIPTLKDKKIDLHDCCYYFIPFLIAGWGNTSEFSSSLSVTVEQIHWAAVSFALQCLLRSSTNPAESITVHVCILLKKQTIFLLSWPWRL